MTSQQCVPYSSIIIYEWEENRRNLLPSFFFYVHNKFLYSQMIICTRITPNYDNN